jgi:hypothetical protein
MIIAGHGRVLATSELALLGPSSVIIAPIGAQRQALITERLR